MNDYKHLPDHDDSLGGTMAADDLGNTEKFQWTDYTKGKSLRDYITPAERRGYRLTAYEQQAILDSLICLGLLVFVAWVCFGK